MKRRKFIEMALSFLANSLFQNNIFGNDDEGLSLASINGYIERDGMSANTILNNIEVLLNSEREVDLILTPEYSFYNEKEPLCLIKNNGEYFLDTESKFIKNKIERVRELCDKNKTNILLGTFAEKDETNEFSNTLLYIDFSGKIIGRKRKFHKLEDNYILKAKNGKDYKILPLICGELFFNKKIPDEKFEILAYTANFGGCDFSILSRYLQGLLDSVDEQAILIAIKNFNEYFNKYYKNLRKGKIIISDGAKENLGAILTYDLKPFKYYKQTNEYVLARF
jgi:hypothetical protein